MKFIRFSLLTLVGLLLVGCGSNVKEKERIDAYSYASYDGYTASSSADYSDTGKRIYIEGTLSKFDFYTFDNIDYLVAIIDEGNNKKWMWKIGQAGITSDEALTKYIGTKVRCFGTYMKKYDDIPTIEIEKYSSDYLIQDYKTSEAICSKADLKPSIKYVQNWFADNADEVIMTQVIDTDKTPGAYYSIGIIDSSEFTDTKASCYLYQKDNNSFERTFVHSSNDDDYLIIPYSDFKDLKDGDSIKLYFIVNEKGIDHLVYCEKCKIDYKLDLEETQSEQIYQNDFDYDGIGTVTFEVNYTKATDSYQFTCNVKTGSRNQLTASALYLYTLFSSEPRIDTYIIAVESSETNEQFGFMQLDSFAQKYWKDANGNLVTDAPDWFNIDNVPESEGGPIILGLDEIYNQVVADCFR
ncbi:hypothetical protein [Butyrivibrio sp. XPD2006]|uniref:hypothetical protein n=1 Tax=Butyrivibrio sp. XPD2006 TaxID=1280668 RepID=UPI0003B5DF7C|nr:hypothetical protein [Butyrivibrio sp. XPD2006]